MQILTKIFNIAAKNKVKLFFFLSTTTGNQVKNTQEQLRDALILLTILVTLPQLEPSFADIKIYAIFHFAVIQTYVYINLENSVQIVLLSVGKHWPVYKKFECTWEKMTLLTN